MEAHAFDVDMIARQSHDHEPDLFVLPDSKIGRIRDHRTNSGLIPATDVNGVDHFPGVLFLRLGGNREKWPELPRLPAWREGELDSMPVRALGGFSHGGARQ
jgi:hypothetical protein